MWPPKSSIITASCIDNSADPPEDAPTPRLSMTALSEKSVSLVADIFDAWMLSSTLEGLGIVRFGTEAPQGMCPETGTATQGLRQNGYGA